VRRDSKFKFFLCALYASVVRIRKFDATK